MFQNETFYCTITRCLSAGSFVKLFFLRFFMGEFPLRNQRKMCNRKQTFVIMSILVTFAVIVRFSVITDARAIRNVNGVSSGGCVDRDPACPMLAQAGQCVTHANYTLEACELSCRNCHSPQAGA
ncbi:uncharacterized protein LOC129602845 [Paramacrobiotus metropolitanus]|uniref:uncharacterized protein LOC129602845 n=1 Tax=Paramacrobiotus metropolitanus TaxID=2943436 RepID=UPI00244635F6|nr:uncharacterized protein LOC129602845 [Paramacrobiotus metropolitanus]